MALLHEEAPPGERPATQAELLWLDLPAYRIRREYVTQLRRQTVTIAAARGDSAPAEAPVTPRTRTRAERAHRRLSWEARLARNRRDAARSGYRFTVFGVVPALAASLGLSADPPG